MAMPQARYAKAATSVLHAYGKGGPFCKFVIPWSFTGAGVYVISLNERVMYVGECQHLAQRFNIGCWDDLAEELLRGRPSDQLQSERQGAE